MPNTRSRRSKATTNRRSTTTKSPEEKAAQRAEMAASIAEKATTLATSEGWIAWLTFCRRFRRYSANNQMLILSAKPDATRVMGFVPWSKMGRRPMKGTGIAIRGHSDRTFVKVNETTGEETVAFGHGWPIVYVFDVSDTYGDDLPAEPEWTQPTGEGFDSYFAQLCDWLHALPADEKGRRWTVARQVRVNGALGSTSHSKREIVIDPSLGSASAVHTLIHEAAHVLLHEDTAQYVGHRGLAETQAESVAYVLGIELGMDGVEDSSIHYIAGWSKADPKVFLAAADGVQKAVKAIAVGLGLDPAAPVEAEVAAA